MSLLVDTTVKASVIVALALGTAGLLRHRSAALRHWVLAAGLLGAALVPVLRPVAPEWTVVAPSPATQPTSFSEVTWQDDSTRVPAEYIAPARPPLTLDQWVWILWATGAAASLCALVTGLARLAQLTRRASPLDAGDATGLAESLGIVRPVALLQSDRPELPHTWGARRPAIVLPAAAGQWSPDRRRIVLLHELAHIGRGDWLTLVGAEIVRSIYWFNPLVWLAVIRLRQEGESACDDVVLKAGVSGQAYATELLVIARAAIHQRALFNNTAAAMARPSNLERRVQMILIGHASRQPLNRRICLGTVAAAVTITLAVAGYGAVTAPVAMAAPLTASDIALPAASATHRQVQPATQKAVIESQSVTPSPAPQSARNVAAPPAAQAFSTLYGIVFDPTNRIMPGVRMSLVNESTQAKYEVQSDGVGRYEFVGLPPGDYAWQATLAGFMITKGRLSISGRTIVRQDIDLRLGSVSELVTISATLQGRDRPGVGGATASDSGTPARPEPGDQAEQVKQAIAELCPRTWAPDSVGGHVRPPMRIRNVNPVYPYSSLSAGTSGIVIMEALLDVNGNISSIAIRKAADPELDRAAVEAVQQWRFIPTLMNCTPVETRYNVTVSFVAR